MYDFGSHDGRLYLVMELIEGWTLAQERSLRGTLPPHEAALVAAQVAAGLSAAHDQGVVHRDIKPANVMLRSDGEPMLMDFGLAARHDETERLTIAGQFMGTPEYAAPEQWRGQAGAQGGHG